MSLDRPDLEPFRCELDRRREFARISPIGEIDIATTPVVEGHLDECEAAGVKQVVLDLREVSFIDSTGLRLILERDARSRADGFAFSLIAGPPTVQRLFDLTLTTERLNFVAASEAEASTG
jgi:anti-anti-sigma factor